MHFVVLQAAIIGRQLNQKENHIYIYMHTYIQTYLQSYIHVCVHNKRRYA